MKFPLNYMKIRNVFGHSQSRKKLKIFVGRERETKIHCIFLLFLFSEKRKMIVSKKEKIVVF